MQHGEDGAKRRALECLAFRRTSGSLPDVWRVLMCAYSCSGIFVGLEVFSPCPCEVHPCWACPCMAGCPADRDNDAWCSPLY